MPDHDGNQTYKLWSGILFSSRCKTNCNTTTQDNIDFKETRLSSEISHHCMLYIITSMYHWCRIVRLCALRYAAPLQRVLLPLHLPVGRQRRELDPRCSNPGLHVSMIRSPALYMYFPPTFLGGGLRPPKSGTPGSVQKLAVGRIIALISRIILVYYCKY